MKKIIFTLICLFTLLCNCCEAKSIKFVQITDVRYGENNSAEILDNAIKDINKMNDIKFVIFTGDNTTYASEEHLEQFIKTAKKLNKPFYIVAGDKDMSKTKKLPREVYAKKVHKLMGGGYPKTLNYTFKFFRSKILFVVVDGAKDYIIMPNGYFNEKTLSWLNETIKMNSKRKIVIFQHFPIGIKPNENEFIHTANAPQYLKLLSQYKNIISVVSGHYNRNQEEMFNGVYHIVTPSLTQKCYKVIEIDESEDYQIFTSLVRMD